ncbi:MAG: hypothetical protein ACJAZ3_001465 [Sphingobacteriales bacterium]
MVELLAQRQFFINVLEIPIVSEFHLSAVWVFPLLQKNHLGFKAISQNLLGAIDVSELSTGFYFAKFTFQNGNKISKQLVIE